MDITKAVEWTLFWFVLCLDLTLESSFSNPSITSSRSQFIFQPFHCFTYVTAHSPTLPLHHLCHSSFSSPSVASPRLQLILQPFRCITYVTAHSPTLPLHHLWHSSFSNPSIASPMSQLILQPFHCFTYVTWWATHAPDMHFYEITARLVECVNGHHWNVPVMGWVHKWLKNLNKYPGHKTKPNTKLCTST